jgi:anaerobic selenocysteine-containing dehydrogenase
MKLGIAAGALLASGEALKPSALAGSIRLVPGGMNFNPETKVERKAIPSACWQCVTRCANIGYVEDGRLVKLESNPASIRTEGKMCAKGQAGINQSYFPDRILYPLRRVGPRGGGKWKRISWDEALTELAGRLKKLRDEGHPEKFMFHYGRMKGSSSKLIKSLFLKEAYGTGTIQGHTSICEGGKWTAQELTWGKHYDNWDMDNTRFILNFGSNICETHTNHVPVAQRMVRARAERGVKMVTFDVRLSNTAAWSDEWVPIRPGTDSAVLLAMCNVIMQNGLYDSEFFKFIKATEDKDASVDKKIRALKSHLKKYTPKWAEKISGVSAKKIESLAKEFAKTKPAVIITYRGAVAHYNGNEAERAAQMLAAITGNIDNPGGRCRGVGAKWKYPHSKTKVKHAKKLKILDGIGAKLPTHHVCQHVLKMIKDGSHGRPEIYMWYCYNPVYVNGEWKENAEVLKDEKMIPFTVTSNIVYDEASKLADMILPDATYLERWDWEDMVSPKQIPEYYIRQPLIKPLGESRDLGDVVCELAERIGIPLGVSSKKEFVKKSHEKTAHKVKGFPGFDYMVKHGVWHDPKAKPKYYGYKKEVKDKDLKKDGVIYDEKTGVYWNWHKSKAKSEEEARKKGYMHTKKAYKGYVGQKIGDKVYKGFKPDKINKSGHFELYSDILKENGFDPLPVWRPIPEHEKMSPDQLVLTTYKVAVQIHSRSTHCKWQTEIYHDNPAWINPATARGLGIGDGDRIRVRSHIDEITTTARVTEGIIPGVIAISYHLGREESGRYASGKKSPFAHDNDPDLKFKWWNKYGVHPNWVIPNTVDPVNGQQRWMDTVVTVTRA